jgi:hypothetical protein
MSNPKRDLMRHFLATLAYRTRKTIVDAPADFGTYDGAGKPPSKILSHMGDLLSWSISWFSEPRWNPANESDWNKSVTRFFALLKELDALLASDAQLRCHNQERMLQGPLADAMTHVGQLAMLRRMSGSPTKPENFAESAVEIGDLSAPASAKSA